MFRDAYCESTGCLSEKFRKTVFWNSMPFHARMIVPFVGGMNAPYFSADRELLAGVERAVDMEHVREDVRDYFMDESNRRWLRRVAKVRISTQRLRDLVRQYLPEKVDREDRTEGKD